MRISLIGAGNIGTLLAVYFKNKGNYITIYTTKKDKWSYTLEAYDKDTDILSKATIDEITDDIYDTVDSDMFVFTVPPFKSKEILDKLRGKIKKDAIIMFYPGFGGMEYACNNMDVTVIGTQRVCSVARLIEYGKKSASSGKRDTIYLGCIPYNKGEEMKKLVSHLFDINVELLPNYLNVTLTPSNPVLHTSRLYGLFKDLDFNKGMEYNPLFYQEWDDVSSDVLIKSDNELHNILNHINLDTSYIKPLLEHYESHDIKSLTNKLISIKSLQNIYSPVIEKDNRYFPDLNSRYFLSDFPYGLLIIKSIGLLTNTETKNIDEVINWYQKLINKEYIKDNKLGKDTKNLLLPQNYNINTVEQLCEFYNR